jgi:hypothetical protein
MLATVGVRGIEAFCSQIISDARNLYVLAVAGYQATVKGIIANLIAGKTLSVVTEDQYLHFDREYSMKYSVHSQKLPSGLYEGIVIPNIALAGGEKKDEFFIMAEDMGDIKDLFFRHLNENTEFPLHQSWTDWLWGTFHEKEWIQKLETPVGKQQGYIVFVGEEELQEVILDAIAMQTPEIMGCFMKGGEYGNI